jgi:hypothetical protein
MPILPNPFPGYLPHMATPEREQVEIIVRLRGDRMRELLAARDRLGPREAALVTVLLNLPGIEKPERAFVEDVTTNIRRYRGEEDDDYVDVTLQVLVPDRSA